MISPDVFDLAHQQHGVVHRHQLIDLAVSVQQIRSARSRGQLMRVFPDVFVVAPATDTFELRCHAVQLWLGGRGFLSGPTAGRLHGLPQMAARPIDFTAPSDTARRPPRWVTLHRSSWYDPDSDRLPLRNGLIVATPERTLFGLATTMWGRRFDRAADDALALGLVTPESIAAYLERHRCRGRNGVARLEAWLERSRMAPEPTRGSFRHTVGFFPIVGSRTG